jgi:predicted metal-dependent hydrolase
MNITYTVNRSAKRRKSISLQIRNEAEVIISAPCFTPAKEINSFVEEKQNWINKNIQKLKEAAVRNKSKEYETGEQFFYLGRSYPLEVFFEPFETEGIVFWNNCFYLNTRGGKDQRKHYFVSWYKKKAYDFFSRRVDFFSRMLKLESGRISITSAEKRWGSCSVDNNLSFSFRLIMAPPDIIDYVIVHELMHIREKNHSPKYWQRVEAAMPEYKKHRRWLKENHHQFIL